METISEVVSGIALAAVLGLTGLLVNRRRKHLKLVVRVLDHGDRQMVDYFNHLIVTGQLQPAS